MGMGHLPEKASVSDLLIPLVSFVMKTVRQTWLLLTLLHAVPVVLFWTLGFPAGFLSLAAVHLTLLGFTLCPRSTPLGRARRSFPADGRTLFLTIDDGPCNDTPAFLELLAAHGAKAIFFLIGERAAARPDLVGAIRAAGHHIGNHTQTHPEKSFWAFGPGAQRGEIGQCQGTLAAPTGERPVWFRAPAGFRNPFTHPILEELNLACLGWTARAFDTRPAPIPVQMARLRPAFVPGAILLIHQGCPHSLSLLAALLTELTAGGWSCGLPPPVPSHTSVRPAGTPPASC